MLSHIQANAAEGVKNPEHSTHYIGGKASQRKREWAEANGYILDVEVVDLTLKLEKHAFIINSDVLRYPA